MFGFDALALGIIVGLLVLVFLVCAYWGHTQQGAGLVAVLFVALVAGAFTGSGAGRAVCGNLDPETGDAPDPEDAAACRVAHAARIRNMTPEERLALEVTAQRGEATSVVVIAAGALGFGLGALSRRIRS
jgi:hypothetical protein